VKKYCTAGQATVRQYGRCALHAGYLRIHTQTQTHTFRICNSYCFFAAKMVAWTRLIITYTCIACLVPIQRCRYVAIIEV